MFPNSLSSFEGSQTSGPQLIYTCAWQQGFQASETLGATQGAEHTTPALATPDVNSWPSEMLELRRNRHGCQYARSSVQRGTCCEKQNWRHIGRGSLHSRFPGRHEGGNQLCDGTSASRWYCGSIYPRRSF